jgi:hypothetical protein
VKQISEVVVYDEQLGTWEEQHSHFEPTMKSSRSLAECRWGDQLEEGKAFEERREQVFEGKSLILKELEIDSED